MRNRVLICISCWLLVAIDLAGGMFYWPSGRGFSRSETIGHGVVLLGGGAIGTVTAASSVVYFILAKWTYRQRHTGRCPTCGYDLRATPDRCPECGTIPQQEAI